MTSRLLIITFFAVLAFISNDAYSAFWRGQTLSAQEARKKWGDSAYTPEKFKTANVQEKAKMAAKILVDKEIRGLPVEKIREKFGSPDGFYFIDAYPAYIIQEGKNQNEETWQIVFLLNSKFEVRDVIVHKNCCDTK